MPPDISRNQSLHERPNTDSPRLPPSPSCISSSQLFARKSIAGAVAGCCESIITSPFEVIKTQMQIEDRRGIGHSIPETVHSILRKKGVPGFYYGLPACLLQNCGKVAIRFGSYSFYTEIFGRYLFGKYSGEDAGSIHRFTSGFFAGATESLWIAPCERLKTLRVTQIVVHSSEQQFTSMLASSRVLLGKSGITEFFVGITPTALRNGSAVGCRFMFYSHLKDYLLRLQGGKDDWWHSIACGFAVGAGTTCITQPLDVLKSRMQGADRGMYGSTLDCLASVYKAEGMYGLSRGFWARMCKIGTGQAVIFGIYESVLKIVTSALR